MGLQKALMYPLIGLQNVVVVFGESGCLKTDVTLSILAEITLDSLCYRSLVIILCFS